MLEFDIRSRDRHCRATGEELRPGEIVYSALVQQEEAVVRMDFSAGAWQAPPENSIGWWKSRIPKRDSNRIYWAPNDVILNYLLELKDKPEQAEVCYLLALLAVRRRILHLEEFETRATAEDEAEAEQTASAGEYLVLTDPKSDAEYRIPVCTPPKERLDMIQQQLCELLFSDEPPEITDDEDADESA